MPCSNADGDFFPAIGCGLRCDGHAEFDQLDAVNRQVLELACLVADVQAVFVGAIRLGGRRLDGDPAGLAVVDHLAAARESFAEIGHPPRDDDLDVRVERLGGKLEATLIVAFASRAVGEDSGADFTGYLQALAGDQRPSDGGAQQVRAFVLGLPLQRGKGKVAAQFLAHVDDPRADGSRVPRLLQDRFPVLAGLSEIDIDRMDLVTLLLQPSQNDGCIESPRVGQYAASHGKSFPETSRGCGDNNSCRFGPLSTRTHASIAGPSLGLAPEFSGKGD